jgi:putative Mg2+ transporter-C (MgtC) family protein
VIHLPEIRYGTFVARVLIATALGLMIGLERQWRQRSAGLHTATLVATGAAIFASLPEVTGIGDSLRVAGQIVTGVGFLAGGVIVREGMNVRGLITAATLWATAAVGVLAGLGFETEATAAALVVLVTNLICWPLASVIAAIPRGGGEQLLTTYTLTVECAEGARAAVRERIMREIASTSLNLGTMSSSAPAGGKIEVVAQFSKPGRDDGAADRLQASVEALPGVADARWDASEKSV